MDTFIIDVITIIIILFSLISGIYYGFYRQLRKTISSIAGFVASIFLTDIALGFLAGFTSITAIITKVINYVVLISTDKCLKLLTALLIFIIVKLIVSGIISIFKPHGTKAFISEKSKLSGFMGMLLGLVNAYVIGCIVYIGFSLVVPVSESLISSKIFSLIPQVLEVINLA